MSYNIGIIVGDITRSRGTERAVANLATLFATSETSEVFILSCQSKNGQEAYYNIPKRVNVIHLGKEKKTLIKRVFGYFDLFNQIKTIVKEHKINVLFGTTHAYNILISFLPRTIKRIGCEHMKYYACPLYSRFIRRLRYGFLDAVVVLTERDGRNYSFVKKEKLFVIPNSLPFIAEDCATLDNKRILAVGGLSYEKGYDEFILIGITLKQHLPDWHIDIFGNGDERETLQALINSQNLSDYITLNPPVKTIEQEYLNSSIYCMTSRYECFPMVLLEAQSCGLPVVAFDCDYGPSELIEDEKTGFLIKNRNTDLFAEKVIKLAENTALRKSMGHEGKLNAMKYVPNEIYKKWEQLLERI